MSLRLECYTQALKELSSEDLYLVCTVQHFLIGELSKVYGRPLIQYIKGTESQEFIEKAVAIQQRLIDRAQELLKQREQEEMGGMDERGYSDFYPREEDDDAIDE